MEFGPHHGVCLEVRNSVPLTFALAFALPCFIHAPNDRSMTRQCQAAHTPPISATRISSSHSNLPASLFLSHQHPTSRVFKYRCRNCFFGCFFLSFLFFASAHSLLALCRDGYTPCLASRAFCRFCQVWLRVFSILLTFLCLLFLPPLLPLPTHQSSHSASLQSAF